MQISCNGSLTFYCGIGTCNRVPQPYNHRFSYIVVSIKTHLYSRS